MADYGLDIAIPYSGDPDPTLPWADDDDMLLVPGSLALFDPAHSANPLVGVPAANADVPNIAWKRLRDLLGTGDASTLAFTRSGADVAGAYVSERTGKGGLHVTVSQTNDTVDGRNISILGKTALANYIGANRAHSFYFSHWMRPTRAALGDYNSVPFSYGYGSGGGNYLYLQWPGAGRLAAAVVASLDDPAAPNTLGNSFRSLGVTGPGTGTGNQPLWMHAWGLAGAYLTASSYGNKGMSSILYRSYIEDLTVSGRTYAQVQALDYALWQAAFGVGGRYAGDTFTAPAI